MFSREGSGLGTLQARGRKINFLRAKEEQLTVRNTGEFSLKRTRAGKSAWQDFWHMKPEHVSKSPDRSENIRYARPCFHYSGPNMVSLCGGQIGRNCRNVPDVT